MRFETFGPFNVPMTDSGEFDDSAAACRAFWQDVDGRAAGLSKGCGCFVFSVLGRDSLPWYVGMTADAPFSAACLSSAVVRHCREVLGIVPHQTVHLHLVAKLTPADRLARPGRRQRTEIRFVGRCLVGFCMNRNPRVAHDACAGYQKHYFLAGMLQGPRDKSTLDQRALRKVLGF